MLLFLFRSDPESTLKEIVQNLSYEGVASSFDEISRSELDEKEKKPDSEPVTSSNTAQTPLIAGSQKKGSLGKFIGKAVADNSGTGKSLTKALSGPLFSTSSLDLSGIVDPGKGVRYGN